MRVALFGGSFDPPHRGHVAIAQAAADQFALDQVLFAPAGRQPLKSQPSGASFDERLAMTTLACMADPRFFPSGIDAPLPDGSPNFTVGTLYTLQDSMPPTAQIFNLVGADSFYSLAQWRDPQKLLELAEWIVVSRPGYSVPNLLGDPPGLELTPAQRARIHLLANIHEDVAATDLRERLRAGDPCKDLLPAEVSGYIHHHHLYLEGNGDRHKALGPGL
jgi:nicotinate-nucleotide adenylyltransferase